MKVAFIGRGGHFSGNTKYLFLHCLDCEFESVFVTTQAPVFEQLSAAGLQVYLLSGNDDYFWAQVTLVVLDDGVIGQTHAAIYNKLKFQLWHGVGPKLAGYAQVKLGSIKLERGHVDLIDHIYSGYDVVTTTSAFCSIMFQQYFKSKKFIQTGFPRNDIFFRNIRPLESLFAQQIEHSGQRALLFAPTFWELGSPTESVVFDQYFLDFLRRSDAKLYVKLHPFSAEGIPASDSVIFLSANTDIYPALKHFDAVITDFSSIASDFALLDRPVIQLSDKRVNYLKHCRDLAYDPRIFRLGPSIEDVHSLCTEVERILSGEEALANERRTTSKLLHAYHDDLSGDRCLDVIRCLLYSRESS